MRIPGRIEARMHQLGYVPPCPPPRPSTVAPAPHRRAVMRLAPTFDGRNRLFEWIESGAASNQFNILHEFFGDLVRTPRDRRHNARR